VEQHTNPAGSEGSDDAPLTSGVPALDASATQPDGKQLVPVWCAVANMTSERPYGPDGSTTKRGSKHFSAGAKLYFLCIVGHYGDPQIEVVGRHRGSHRYVRMIVSLSWLENWRKDLVYSPHVARALQPYWTGSRRSELEAESYVQRFLNWAF
jgi:hypothetical protein